MLTIWLDQEDGSTRLRLRGALRIETARQAKTDLLDALSAHRELECDLSDVAAIDAAGLQLLLMLKREAQRRDHQLRLIGHSPAVVELFELYQLAGQFGDPVVLPIADGASR